MCKAFVNVDCLTSKNKLTMENEYVLGEVTSENCLDRIFMMSTYFLLPSKMTV